MRYLTETQFDDSALYALFFRCCHILQRHMGARVSRQRMLSLLCRNGAMTQMEIQQTLGIQEGSLSELAARLEERGLITRERDKRDKRRILLHLTDAGREMAGQGTQVGDAELFACLSAEEQDALRVMLNKIADAHNNWKKAEGFR